MVVEVLVGAPCEVLLGIPELEPDLFRELPAEVGIDGAEELGERVVEVEYEK